MFSGNGPEKGIIMKIWLLLVESGNTKKIRACGTHLFPEVAFYVM